jgi:hypothetical protein
MDQAAMPYEARYGLNRQSLRVIVLSLAFCAAALLPVVPLVLKVLVFVFFGGIAAVLVAVSLPRTIALRVDQLGITLCASPLYPKSTTRLFRWEDVANVMIWQGDPSGRINRLEYVGVERRPGAPPITGKFVGRRAQSAARLNTPGIPPEVALTRAATNGWVLDHERLTATVTHFAPWVHVIDATAGQLPGEGFSDITPGCGTTRPGPANHGGHHGHSVVIGHSVDCRIAPS